MGARSTKKPERSLVVLLLLAATLLVAALACEDQATMGSGIEGEVFIGPINPVVSEGQGDDSRPYSALIRIKSVPEGELVAEVTSDEQGRFRVALAPGRYLVEPQQGDPLPTASSRKVTVVEGKFTPVRIDYDSGIR